ncbi:MAG: dihydrofolate reductase [Clostridiales Family XIII bacterium]|nr:dihydrofolate reductase [Clostridiales Family XIII bacterium]
MRALTERGIRFHAIAAVDRNWGIGRDGRLLARIPGDLKYFREATMGRMLIMGRKTLESLPGGRPLQGRKTIVLTRRRDFAAAGAVAVHSIRELVCETERACAAAEDGMAAGGDQSARGADTRNTVFVAGGATVYATLLPYVDVCLITKIDRIFDADAFFPNLDAADGFSLARAGDPIEEDGLVYRFTEYRRGDGRGR